MAPKLENSMMRKNTGQSLGPKLSEARIFIIDSMFCFSLLTTSFFLVSKLKSSHKDRWRGVKKYLGEIGLDLIMESDIKPKKAGFRLEIGSDSAR